MNPSGIAFMGPPSEGQFPVVSASDIVRLVRGDRSGYATVAQILGLAGEVVSLTETFGATGDGSPEDGAVIRGALETTIDNGLSLIIPKPPQNEGWRLDAAVTRSAKSGFALLGEPGAAISKRGGSFDFLDLTGCSDFRVSGLGFDARNGEAGIVLRDCAGMDWERISLATGRGFQLFDGTRESAFRRIWVDGSTAAFIFGEGDGGAIPGHADVADILVEDLIAKGTRQEALEWANGVRRLTLRRITLLDCNTAGASEECVDLGGPAADVTFEDILIDLTGAYSSYTSTAIRCMFIKRANGANPTNIRVIRPTFRMTSADATSAPLLIDDVDGWYLEGGLIEGDTERSVNVGGSAGGGGFGYVGGTRMVGAREASLRAVGSSTVTGFARVFLEPDGGGAETLTGGSATIDLV